MQQEEDRGAVLAQQHRRSVTTGSMIRGSVSNGARMSMPGLLIRKSHDSDTIAKLKADVASLKESLVSAKEKHAAQLAQQAEYFHERIATERQKVVDMEQQYKDLQESAENTRRTLLEKNERLESNLAYKTQEKGFLGSYKHLLKTIAIKGYVRRWKFHKAVRDLNYSLRVIVEGVLAHMDEVQLALGPSSSRSEAALLQPEARAWLDRDAVINGMGKQKGALSLMERMMHLKDVQTVASTWLMQCRKREQNLRMLSKSLGDSHTQLLANHKEYCLAYSEETFQQFKAITKYRLRDAKDEIAALKMQLVQAGQAWQEQRDLNERLVKQISRGGLRFHVKDQPASSPLGHSSSPSSLISAAVASISEASKSAAPPSQNGEPALHATRFVENRRGTTINSKPGKKSSINPPPPRLRALSRTPSPRKNGKRLAKQPPKQQQPLTGRAATRHAPSTLSATFGHGSPFDIYERARPKTTSRIHGRQ